MVQRRQRHMKERKKEGKKERFDSPTTLLRDILSEITKTSQNEIMINK